MRTRSTFILSALIIMLSTSCVHYYYAPNTNNVTLFKQKDEARVQVSYSENSSDADNSSLSGFELQSAYAIGKNTAVQVNLFHTGEKDKDYGSGHGTYIEGAFGYFKPSKNEKWIFETYAGLGTASVLNKYAFDGYGSAKTSVTKFFLQPSYAFSSRDIDIAFSSKFSLVNFGVKNSQDLSETGTNYDDIQALQNTKSKFFWEPGIMLRGGFKNVKFSVQYTHCVTGNTNFSIAKSNISAGVVFLINPKNKK